MAPIPPSPDEIDFTLLDRFLAGECSPVEADSVRQWLAHHGGDARYFSAVRDALLPRRATPAYPDDTDTLWARLARDTVDAERNARRLPPPLTVSVPG